MIERRVILSPEARDDLLQIYDWIAEAASPEVAMAYLERLEIFCAGLGLGSERGQIRDEVRPGLRVIGFERRVAVAFTVAADAVTVLRVLAAGRDWNRLL